MPESVPMPRYRWSYEMRTWVATLDTIPIKIKPGGGFGYSLPLWLDPPGYPHVDRLGLRK